MVNIVICCTGSVASIKIPDLINQLIDRIKGINIKLVHTKNATHFFDLKSIHSSVTSYSDDDEWANWKELGDPVLHIELRKWADILLLAPCDANTLSKIATGLCDNLITCVIRAWDLDKPLIFCPAMNTFMWSHPITSQQIGFLKSFGYHMLGPISKKLACGDKGAGAMSEVSDIVGKVSSLV